MNIGFGGVAKQTLRFWPAYAGGFGSVHQVLIASHLGAFQVQIQNRA